MAFDGGFDGGWDGGWDGAAGGGPAPIPTRGEVGTSQYVVAIEGYPYLLTDGDLQPVLDAWTGSPWSQVLPGLVMDLDLQQELDPYDPIRGGGTARAWVQPDDDDTFGIATHRTDASPKTYLSQTADRDDTTIHVLSTAGFDSAGEACIGNETFSYAGVTATTFTGCVRGLYAPFPSAANAPYFAEHHRVGNVDYGVPLNPIVSQHQRTWKGRWVGVFRHVKTGTELDDYTEARCVFAGRLAEIAVDPGTGWTVVDVEHILDSVRQVTILRDPFAGTVREGVYMITGGYFKLTEVADTDNATDPLVVVTSGASGANEIDSGYYTAEELLDKLNTWLASELAATNIDGTYSWSIKLYEDGPRVSCNWSINTATPGDPVFWEISMPQSGTMVAQFLGLGGGHIGSGARWFSGEQHGVGDEHYDDGASNPSSYHGTEAPFRVYISRIQGGGDGVERQIAIDDTRGTFVDCESTMPPVVQDIIAAYPGLEWGIFDIDNSVRVVGAFDGTDLLHVKPVQILSGQFAVLGTWDTYAGRRYGDGDGPVEIKQVVMLAGGFADIVKALFASTGTLAYNDVDFDAFVGYGCGAGIPYSMLGDEFEASLDNLAAADGQIMVQVDKPTKLVDLIKSDLLLRRAHLVFKDGKLQFRSWSTPTTANADHALTDANKAEPAGNRAPHRIATLLSSEWARPIIKIFYNRTSTGEYKGSLTIEDRSAIDDLGGVGESVEIPARNVIGHSSDVAELFPALVAWHAFFSRPIRIATRSVDMSLQLDITPGDVVTVSDDDLRDPTTGRRGVDTLPALVTKVRVSPGGPTPGDPRSIRPPVGEVTLAFLELGGTAPYAPCAEIDETNDTGNYDAGYDSVAHSIACKANVHSESGAAHDATRFPAGSLIRIVEIDPDDPAAPVTWLRTVASQSGDEIFLTSALSSPAWDHDKQYRVISQTYSDATAAQHLAGSYQADDDGDIEDDAGPYLYGDATLPAAFTRGSHTDLPERSADLAGTDGAPRDTGYERGLCRMVNNLLEHKTSVQAPCLDTFRSVITPGGPGDWHLHSSTPFHVGEFKVSDWLNFTRAAWTAPFIKSTDGSSTDCRVSLCTQPPTGDSWINVTRQGAMVSQTYSTSDTTGEIPTPEALILSLLNNNPNPDGLIYLVIEQKEKCSVLGIGELIVRERGNV